LRAAEFPDKPTTSEVGSSGITFGSVGRLQQQEYLPDLIGPAAYRIYERMRRSDPKIVGLRRALDLPILRAHWDIVPSEDDNPRAEEIADFVEENLFNHIDLPWPQMLAEILLYQDFGFAPFEKVWEIEDGKVYLKRLGYLPPHTVQEIYVVDRKVKSIDQFSNSKGLVNIPGDKLVWFVNRKEGDNYRGIPMLRSFYRPWFNKERAEILLLVMAERMGGWLKFITPDGATPADVSAAKQIGNDFRINETMYMVLPPRWDATVESSTGMTLADLQGFIRYCDEQIDAAALAQVLDLGTSSEGSRALGRTLGEIFDESVQSTGDYICDIVNAEGGLIEELIAYNFPDWEEYIPKLTVGKVEKMDLKNWALGFQALANAGVKFGGKTHAWIREEAGLPEEEEMDEKATDEMLNPPKPPAPVIAPAVPGQPGVKKGPYVPPGEGDSNPTKGDVQEQPED